MKANSGHSRKTPSPIKETLSVFYKTPLLFDILTNKFKVCDFSFVDGH